MKEWGQLVQGHLEECPRFTRATLVYGWLPVGPATQNRTPFHYLPSSATISQEPAVAFNVHITKQVRDSDISWGHHAGEPRPGGCGASPGVLEGDAVEVQIPNQFPQKRGCRDLPRRQPVGPGAGDQGCPHC